MKWQGRSVLITGGARGIGKELAVAYAEAGAFVTIGDIEVEEGEQTAELIRSGGGSVRFVKADMRNPDDVASLVKHAAEASGGAAGIDAVVNNAGIGRWKSPLELTLEEWDDVIHTNLRGSFLCAREAAAVMKSHGTKGSIVNIASTRAFMSEPNSEAYAASKGGLVALTHALALSLGPYGIRVNAISPGWIETGDRSALRPIDHVQHPAGRVGTPQDIVKAAFYLTDPDNSFVTGTNMVVDGGMTRKMIYEE
ncbi:SDR family NAD(P)-dependent oxidoreductase [Paenibacillus chartarius]|uniref:SDR family NAD(P)-dependent oxidoreductase n=1 Tax=Paenibacillus chartarius TaxID=747481 RepID=A0ABV6DQX6_9BACL